MASNLRVDTILPSSGTNVAIGTASGTVSLIGDSNLTTSGNLTIGGNLGVGGTLTYEDVTNVDSVGVITARSGIRIGTGGTVGPVGSGIVTYFGDGSQLTGAGPSLTGSTNNTIVTVTGANAIQGESGLTYNGTRLDVTTGDLQVIGGEGGNAEIRIVADQGDDGADYWRFQSAASGNNLNIATYASGAWVDKVSVTSGGDVHMNSSALSSPYTAFRNLSISNNLILNAQTAAGGFAGMQNNAYLNSSGNWVRVNNDHATSIGTDDGTFYLRNVTAGTGNISWKTRFIINSDGTSGHLGNNYNLGFYNDQGASGSYWFMRGSHSASGNYGGGTDVYFVRTNGNVQNANNSYGSSSDIKLKENVVDASSQWNDIKNLKVRKFNNKAETGYETKTHIGLIAQEAELISAGLVEDVKDTSTDSEGKITETGTVTKHIKYSVLYMKSVKALQEAQARIETLEAEVAALKSS